jgi:UDP-glucose 4-epimerase
MTRFLIAGGCGFIGSHVVKSLLSDASVSEVRVFDNLSSGSLQALNESTDDPRVSIHVGELRDLEYVTKVMDGVDHVFHFAANPDIAKAMTDPTIDFWEGTLLTQNILEAMRRNQARALTYASGSGVYGNRSHEFPDENFGPLFPVSPYGASKLACEAMISAYCHMFGFQASAFRFANVVGDNQTHGVVYDFVRKLRANPRALSVLGDGSQEKSYIHVRDVVKAMMIASPGPQESLEIYNVSTGDYITVREIADMVVAAMGLHDVTLTYGTESRGWRGDVGIVRFADDKIRALGWRQTLTTREAIANSIEANILESLDT